MTTNIMQSYINRTEKFLKDFNKIFFLEEYDKEIEKKYIETYIDARIYNFGEEKQRFFYRRIYASLINTKKEIKKQNPRIDEKVLENMLKIYQFIFYLDGVRQIQDLKEFCKMICNKREKKFEYSKTAGLEDRFYKLIKDFFEWKEKFFKSFETEDFELDIQKYVLIDNTYKVDLKYNFKIPYIYSDKAIDEVFNEGTINEDKLIVEYTLLTMVCIEDINKANFQKKYIVNFAKSLFEKEKKIKQVLRVLDDQAIKDKIFLKINYQDFLKYKDIVYENIKDGFRFAIYLDDENISDIFELKKLDMFKYLLIPKQNKNYDIIKGYENRLNNILIYE